MEKKIVMKKVQRGNIEIVYLDKPAGSNLGSVIDEHVRNKLKKDQEKRQFKDQGRYVAGSKKEMAAYRKLLSEGDLDTIEQDEASAIELVVKDNIWEKIDVEQLQDSGISSGAAYLIVELRKAFAPKPIVNTKEQRKAYVNYSNIIQSQLTDVVNVDDLQTLFRLYNNYNKLLIGYLNAYSVISNLLTDIEYSDLLNHYSIFKREHPELYQNLIDYKVDEKELTKMINGETQVINIFDRYNVYKVLKQKASSKFANLLMQQGKSANVKWELAKEYEKNNDWSWTSKKQITTKERNELTINTGKPLSFVKRKGGVFIPEKYINEKSIIDNFGYSGVQIGKAIPDSEVKEHINHFIGAMSDLHQVLNWDLKFVNKLGNLAIAFASRGKGKAMAHYEPLRRIINLTRKSGDGTVAHEWFHFLDHLLGIVAYGRNNNKLFSKITEKYDFYNYADELKTYPKIFLNISYIRQFYETNKYYSKKDNQTLKLEDGEFIKKIKANPGKYSFSYGDSPDEALHNLYKRAPHYFRYPYYHKNAEKVLGSIAAYYGMEFIKVKLKREAITKWYIDSKQYGKYWSSTEEMFARGFEVYVFNKLRENGMENNYLVSGSFFDHDSGVYPQGKEAEVVTELFDNLIEAIKYELEIPDFKAISDQEVNTMIRLDKQGNVKEGKTFVLPQSDKIKLKLKLQKAKLELLNINN